MESHGEELSKSDARAFINTLKSWLGAAVLGMPFAFHSSGWLGGLIGLFLTVNLVQFTSSVLLRGRMWIEDCSTQNNFRSSGKSDEKDTCVSAQVNGIKTMSYPDFAYHVLGDCGYLCVVLGTIIVQFGACVSYIIFMSHALEALFPSTNNHMWIGILAPILLALSSVQHMRSLAPASFLATICFITGMVTLFTTAWQEREEKTEKSIFFTPFKWDTFPTFLGIALFAMEGVATVFPLQDSMELPRRYPSILNITFVVLFFTHSLVGIVGWSLFGDSVQSVITHSIPYPTKHHSFTNTVLLYVAPKILLVIYILFTYPIMLFPVPQMIRDIFSSRQKRRMGENIQHNATFESFDLVVRWICVLLTLVVAYCTRSFGEFMSLIGWVGFGPLGLIVPCLCFLELSHPTNQRTVIKEQVTSQKTHLTIPHIPWERSVAWSIVIFATIASLLGTFHSIKVLWSGTEE